MNHPTFAHKITSEHLTRRAVVYLRQSSQRQVKDNRESQRLQYALSHKEPSQRESPERARRRVAHR